MGPIAEDALDKCKVAFKIHATFTHCKTSKCLMCTLTLPPYFGLAWPHRSHLLTCLIKCKLTPWALCFHIGGFTERKRLWFTSEKEAFAEMVTAQRMHWLLKASNGFKLYEEIHNLTFHFNFFAVVPNLWQTPSCKVHFLVVRLCAY